MAGSTSSPEYATVRRCFGELVAAVSLSPKNISVRMFSMMYISHGTYEYVNRVMDTNDIARRLVSALSDRVKNYPTVYHGFIKILEDEGTWTRDLREALQTCYQDEKDGATTGNRNDRRRLEIVKQPVDKVSCVFGEPLELSIESTGEEPLSFQWYKDDQSLSYGIAPTLRIPVASLSDSGEYQCAVYNRHGFVRSEKFTVDVTAGNPNDRRRPKIVKQPVDKVTCVAGEPLELSIEATGDGPLVFQWYKDNQMLLARQAPTLSVPVASLRDSGEYSCHVTFWYNSDGVMSNPVTVNVVKDRNESLETFCSAIQTKGSKLKQTVMQLTVQGVARSGKTSIIKVLEGEEADPKETSTGAMNEPTRIDISKSTVLLECDDADCLIWTAIKNLQQETSVLVQEVNTHHSNTSTTATKSPPVSLPLTSQPARYEQPSESIQLPEIFEVAIEKAKGKMKNIKNPWTVYISDFGGQLEFQELVPALIYGPSLHAVVMRATQCLDRKMCIEYLHKNGESADSYVTEYTAKEDLLRRIATIMSTGREGQLPKIMVILTFKDQVTEEQLKEMDQELQEAVKTTDAYKNGVIQFAEESLLCHPINNLDPDEADVMRIRKTVERIGRENDVYQISTPYKWLFFSIVLREIPKQVLSYDECLEVGRRCGLGEIQHEEEHGDSSQAASHLKEAVDAALKFLHDEVGIIRHFSGVDDLRGIVIKEPQLLFDNVSELVVNTFTFARVNQQPSEDFKKRGIFPADLVSKLNTGCELLTNQRFVSFLTHHHILAPLKEGGVVTKYFLPCSLVHADVRKDDLKVSSNPLPFLLVTFDTGYTPRGLLGFMVTDLLETTTNESHTLASKEVDQYSLNLDQKSIYRDQFTLLVGPYLDKFRFSVRPKYIQIEVLPSSLRKSDVPLGKICCFVRQRVSSGLSKIVQKLNYNCKTSHSFFCSCLDGYFSKKPHPAQINLHEEQPKSLKCTIDDCEHVRSLPAGHKVWFNKDECQPATPIWRKVSTGVGLLLILLCVLGGVLCSTTCTEGQNKLCRPVCSLFQTVSHYTADPCSNNLGPSPLLDTMPTMLLLHKFSLSNEETVDIIAEAAINYKKFGRLLLNDETGSKMINIERSKGPDPTDIMTNVFVQWLAGKGQKPVSWRTLAKTLCDADLHSLYSHIVAQYSTSSKIDVDSVEKTEL